MTDNEIFMLAQRHNRTIRNNVWHGINNRTLSHRDGHIAVRAADAAWSFFTSLVAQPSGLARHMLFQHHYLWTDEDRQREAEVWGYKNWQHMVDSVNAAFHEPEKIYTFDSFEELEARVEALKQDADQYYAFHPEDRPNGQTGS